ncbi:hypothetical protein [Pontibacter sp. G13]|uniref:hypothetical protein n=1 Tax=Pontibacter sp. G13 TaxID=3074898 RepID=UPI002889A068|nr:hypothetical protein [Pontibacter sp. G13]WNJ20706.1 hypothetical protein RJD25_09510 [Pontibacter sp. G13]
MKSPAFLLLIPLMLLTSCIGDKQMLVTYSIKNKTSDTLWIGYPGNFEYLPYSNLFELPPTIALAPGSKKHIAYTPCICAFGDCQGNIQDILSNQEPFLVFGDSLRYLPLPTRWADWKIKKRQATMTMRK